MKIGLRKVLTDAEVERILEMLEKGTTLHSIRKEILVSECTLLYELEQRGYDPKKYSFIVPEIKKEQEGIELTRKAKAYWNSFNVGDYIIAHKEQEYKGKRKKTVQVKANIIFKNDRYLLIVNPRNNKKVTITFSEIASKDIKIRKIDTEGQTKQGGFSTKLPLVI